MSQSRAGSAAEATLNVLVGWLVALLVQMLVFPVVGLQAALLRNLNIGGVFTAVSLVRSYMLRRLFSALGEG